VALLPGVVVGDQKPRYVTLSGPVMVEEEEEMRSGDGGKEPRRREHFGS
jgi:hypothetical protein